MMKVTVCELPNTWINSKNEIDKLSHRLESEKSDLLLLPEMPFYTWLAGNKTADIKLWKTAVEYHNIWLEKLTEFNVPARTAFPFSINS